MVDIVGVTSSNCPTDDCYQADCYTPCEHRTKVIDSVVARPQRKQAFLYDLIWSILEVQEELNQQFCADPDITEVGTAIGFAPVQCGYLEHCAGKVILCPVDTCYGCEEPIQTSCDGFGTPDCEPCQYHELTPYMTSCCGNNSCDDKTTCPPDKTWVDLSQGDYLPIYTELVNYLNCATGTAGGENVNAFAESLGGKLLGIRDGVYSVELPNTFEIRSIVEILKNIIPLPIGAGVKFYVEVC